MTPDRSRNELGYSTLEFLLALALIIFPLSLLVLLLPSWYETATMTRVASREAARTFVLTGDEGAARASAQNVAAHYGGIAENITVTLEGDPNIAGSLVQAHVQTTLRPINIAMLDVTEPGFTVQSRHSEAVDVYRSIQ